ncbi:MAG TPA: hydantoinase B/oxoprolinase family protein [Flavobacteriaceae bacterium]|nr:hydantoinase B/oxoprolinase family protein [Flavobacteriaceae bacterium]
MTNNTKTIWEIAIDTGGTFTDCIAIDPQGKRHKTKVLSNSSLRGTIKSCPAADELIIEHDWDAPDDFIKGFSFQVLDRVIEENEVVSYDAVNSTIHLKNTWSAKDLDGCAFAVVTKEEPPILAARLITKTLPDQNLPPINLRLATTRGTNALLERAGAPTALLVTEGFRDLLEIGTQQRPDIFSLNIQKPAPLTSHIFEVPERIDAEGKVIKPLDFAKLDDLVKQLKSKDVETVAVALMNSYENDTHEQEIKQYLSKKGIKYLSLSSELSELIKILPRTQTCLVNAYLEPIIKEYINSVKNALSEGSLLVMTSAGGLVTTKMFNPKDSLLSGPAGGVIGASTVGKQAGFNRVISFDMGGTSSDVARFGGNYEYVFEHIVGDAQLVAPALSIETVAAGGGSICAFDGYSLTVGPDSAGAHPGPACYGVGGPLTVTDVNLLLGRLDPKNFGIPISIKAAEDKLEEIRKAVSKKEKKEIEAQVILEGFLNIANERMAGAINKISLRKGYNPSEYALVSFGGAGSQHCCAIADKLKIESIIIPPDAGVLSAYGLENAVAEQFVEKQLLLPLEKALPDLKAHFSELAEEAKAKLRAQDILQEKIMLRRQIILLRLKNQESTLEIEYDREIDVLQKFKEKYTKRYGHWIENSEVEIASLKVIASTKSEIRKSESTQTSAILEPNDKKEIGFGGKTMETQVFYRSKLDQGGVIKGPALILDPYSTIVVEPQWELKIDDEQNLILNRKANENEQIDIEHPEAIKLELFTNRFMAIAEEMGEALQRTALSVNVKERLDFSCAILNPEGKLVVNAPHIPVHLGALGLCVRRVAEYIEMKPGDVIITNDPAFGGAHLPDITVITPVFHENEKLICYVASRAHHSEIGGIRPGSMPPDATNLEQEGVVIKPTYLVKEGKENWEHIKNILANGKYPSRSIAENVADLRAAVAANQKGATALQDLAKSSGSAEVNRYMNKLENHASSLTKERLKTIPDGIYKSTEYMDDDTPISAKLKVKGETLAIDFTGTGAVHPNNLNATPAIVNLNSATL